MIIHHLKAHFHRNLLISLFPLLLGCLTSLFKAQSPHKILQFDSFGIYDNYFAFLFVMILGNIIIRIAQQIMISKSPDVTKQVTDYHSSSEKKKRYLCKIIIAIISYTLLFFVYQVIGLSIGFISARNGNSFGHLVSVNTGKSQINTINPLNHQEDFPINHMRILTEEEEAIAIDNNNSILTKNQQQQQQIFSQPQKEEKFTLSMGKIKSELELDASAMLLSRDQKLAFVALRLVKIMQIIDISDFQSPKIIGSMGFGTPSFFYINIANDIPALALSSDEKTLFISNFFDLDIIDITDLKSPQKICATSNNELSLFDISRIKKHRASLALDESTNTLFIGGLGLATYDISNLAEPELIGYIANPITDESRNDISHANEIKLSSDLDLKNKVLFMANDTLNIFNISNPREISLINSLETPSSAGSLHLTSDPNRILLVGISDEEGIKMDEVDVSNYSSPKIIKSYQLGYPNTQVAHFLGTSPCQTRYSIFTYTDSSDYEHQIGLLSFDDITKKVTKNPQTLIKMTHALEFSKDGKNIITAANRQFLVIELLENYPNTEIFEFEPNQIGNFSLSEEYQQMELSPDGKTMFIFTGDSTEASSFEIWNLTDPKAPYQLGSIAVSGGALSQMYFPSHYQTAYLVFGRTIVVLNISDRSSPSIIRRSLNNDLARPFDRLIITSDEKTGFVLQNSQLAIFNFSDSSSSEIEPFWASIVSNRRFNCHVILKDDRTLLLIDEQITIYDISNIESPVDVTSVPIASNNDENIMPTILSAHLSPDENILYVQLCESGQLYRLQIYNISVLSKPYLVTDIPFYQSGEVQPSSSGFITFTPDFKTGFINQKGTLLKIKFPKQNEFKIFGLIPLSVDPDETIHNFLLFPDGQTIYDFPFPDKKTVNILSTHPKYTLYLKNEKFLLGQKHSENIGVLGQTSSLDYDLMNQNSYKIIKLSLFDIQVVPSKQAPEFIESVLPSWIELDNKKNLLTLEPQNPKNVGTYTLQSAVSLKIPDDAFDHLDVSSDDLLAWLISLDYIDNQLFLTESFASIKISDSSSSSGDNLKTFYLPAQFKSYKQQIYDILKKYYVKTCTTIEIIPSLELNVTPQGNLITISTPSSDNIKVDIDLISPQNSQAAQFLHKSYAPLSYVAIENKPKPRLHFEGNLKDINKALQSIVINFAENDKNTNCDTNLIIQDGLNKPLTVSLTNVAKLFIPNQPPELNQTALTIQQQINTTDIYTGQHFTLDFDQYTFTDNYADTLTYELAMAASNKEVPKWLTLTGLKLRGSPPEEVLDDIELVLIARNEFKEIRESFRLRVKISLVLFFKLLLKYGSYVLSLVGLIISINKILNILGKGSYKHPKEYVLHPGEKVTAETIAPIFFVLKEKQEARFIISHLEKYISAKMERKSVTKSMLVNYFVDSQCKELDKQKVINTIQEIISHLPLKKQEEELSHYCSIQNSRKSLIDQLITDQLTLWQLDQDKETKPIFEKMKEKWVEIAYWDSSLSKFSLDHNKFEKIVEENFFQSQPSSSQKESSLLLTKSELHDDSSIQLIPGVNINLLRDSILAYAFGNHQINRLPVKVEVSMKEQVKSNFIWRFLKRDLKGIRKINYGIDYEITDDILNFSGITKRNLGGKALVLQIETTRNRILKEIWVRGASTSHANQEAAIHNDNNNYEVY